MIEPRALELDLKILRSQVASQTDVPSDSRSEVDVIDRVRQATGFDRLAHEIDGRSEQLVGVGDVVGSFADANEFNVLARQADQAVDGGTAPDGSRPNPALGTSDDGSDPTDPLFHLLLPGRQA
jgi:hypothetical protein